jgi:hypothetical protein
MHEQNTQRPLKWSLDYRIETSEVADDELRGTLEWAAHTLAYFAEKVERLEQHVDAAFAHASSGDAHAARLELTKARWGS